MKRILVVDDERQITRLLKTALQAGGYSVVTADNGVQALEEFTGSRPDMIITDLAMPLMNGLELTQAIRKIATTPILVLSVRNTDAMKIAALDEGADDYLSKPFSMPELLARVRAHLRRAVPEEVVQGKIEAGEFAIDVGAHTVTVRGAAVHLTPKEFELLVLLARSPGRVLTHKVLLRAIWGPAGHNQPEYLRVLIAGLRKKIEHGEGQRFIHSEPWIGYRFEPSLHSVPTIDTDE